MTAHQIWLAMSNADALSEKLRELLDEVDEPGERMCQFQAVDLCLLYRVQARQSLIAGQIVTQDFLRPTA